MSTSIRQGGLLVKDPDATEVYTFDWDDEHLEAAVTITGTPNITVTLLSGVSTGLMTSGDVSLLTGNRKVQFSLTGGTLGQKYQVTNRIVTNESPAQTKDASFKVLVQEQ